MLRFSGSFLFFLMILLAGSKETFANIINASSCSQTDVQTAINSASNGDTINIPSGSCTWTTKITISKSIYVIGAGIGKTVITDGVSGDDMILMGNSSSAIAARISGLSITGSAAKTGFKAMISWNYATAGLGHRVDHCQFDNRTNLEMAFHDSAYGVVDHNVFNNPVNMNQWVIYFEAMPGDLQWSQPDNFGGSNFVFLEDNTFNNTSGAIQVASDSEGGARYVWRYNTFNGFFFRAHGTDSVQNGRGTRIAEIYNNKFYNNFTIWTEVLEWRSGTAVFYNNQSLGTGGFNTGINLKEMRDPTQGLPHWLPYCDGTFYGDQNTPGANPAGSLCLDQPGTGQSDLIITNTSGSAGFSPQLWPHQQSSPVYAWANTGLGGSEIGATSNLIKTSRDYFNSAKPGYVAYSYPHPLTSNGSMPSSPSNIVVK